jgi:hypothetical protein
VWSAIVYGELEPRRRLGDGRAALQELVATGGRTAFELDS